MLDKIENFIDLLDIDSIYSTDSTHVISFKYMYVTYRSSVSYCRSYTYMFTDIDQVADAIKSLFDRA